MQQLWRSVHQRGGGVPGVAQYVKTALTAPKALQGPRLSGYRACGWPWRSVSFDIPALSLAILPFPLCVSRNGQKNLWIEKFHRNCEGISFFKKNVLIPLLKKKT